MAKEKDDDLDVDMDTLLAGLSPEERAAIEDDDEVVDTKSGAQAEKDAKAAGKDDADDDADTDEDLTDEEILAKSKAKDDEDEEDDDEEEEEVDDVKAKVDDAPADKAKADADPVEVEARDERFRPVFHAEPVENYEQKLSDLDNVKAEAFKKYSDGDMTPEDYAKIESKYLADRDALNRAQDRAIHYKDMAKQQAEQEWQFEVRHMFRNAAKEGIDYVKNEEYLDAFDSWCKALGTNPKHADKSGEWFVNEAHKMVKLQFGIGAPAEQKAEHKAEQKQDQKKRAPDLSKIPPTLAKVPPAKNEDTDDGGEFAYLEKLSGMELERALSKMSPEQAERYLAQE